MVLNSVTISYTDSVEYREFMFIFDLKDVIGSYAEAIQNCYARSSIILRQFPKWDSSINYDSLRAFVIVIIIRIHYVWCTFAVFDLLSCKAAALTLDVNNIINNIY